MAVGPEVRILGKIALSKAVTETIEALVSYSRWAVLQRYKDRRIQHQALLDQHRLHKSLEDHLEWCRVWSDTVHLVGMPKAKSIGQIYIGLALSDDPRRMRLIAAERPTYSIEDILKTTRHFVVLGDPGSGKTTTLKKIAFELLKGEDFGSSAVCPLVVRFRDLRGEISLIKWIKEYLGVRFAPGQVPPALPLDPQEMATIGRQVEFESFAEVELRATTRFLDSLGLFLLLDGLDEVSPTARDQVLSELSVLAPRLEKARIALTVRSADFMRQPEFFSIYEIQPMSEVQITHLSTLWFTSSDERKYTPEAFLSALKSTPYVDLATKPLTLANLCLVFEKYGRLPDFPVSVYRKIIAVLLEEWDADRGVIRVSKYAAFDPQRKQDFLAALAFTLITERNGALAFTLSDLRNIYLKLHERFGLPRDEADEVAREIESHTGIVVRVTYDTFEFAHKSLQEYLVAEHLARLRNVPDAITLLRNCPNELAISAALSSDPTDWLCGLFRNKGKRIKPRPEWLVPFFARLHMENPGFEITPELGATLLWLIARLEQHVDHPSLQGFLGGSLVLRSTSSFLSYCEFRPRGAKGESIMLRCSGLPRAKYPIVKELVLSRLAAERIETLRIHLTHGA
jgi:hypothetical protein